MLLDCWWNVTVGHEWTPSRRTHLGSIWDPLWVLWAVATIASETFLEQHKKKNEEDQWQWAMRTSLLLVELVGLGWVGLVGLGLQWPLISSGLNDPNPRSFEWVLKIKKKVTGDFWWLKGLWSLDWGSLERSLKRGGGSLRIPRDPVKSRLDTRGSHRIPFKPREIPKNPLKTLKNPVKSRLDTRGSHRIPSKMKKIPKNAKNPVKSRPDTRGSHRIPFKI